MDNNYRISIRFNSEYDYDVIKKLKSYNNRDLSRILRKIIREHLEYNMADNNDDKMTDNLADKIEEKKERVVTWKFPK
jgi:hypothetical protein